MPHLNQATRSSLKLGAAVRPVWYQQQAAKPGWCALPRLSHPLTQNDLAQRRILLQPHLVHACKQVGGRL